MITVDESNKVTALLKNTTMEAVRWSVYTTARQIALRYILGQQ